jgi:hypothetical protein
MLEVTMEEAFLAYEIGEALDDYRESGYQRYLDKYNTLVSQAERLGLTVNGCDVIKEGEVI